MPNTRRAFRTLTLLLVVGLAALGARPATAGINRWTGFGPGAGTIQTLLVDPARSGALYVLTRPTYDEFAGGEIYKSVDRGASWKWSGTGLPLLHHAEPQALALDPARPGTLYTARRAEVFRSTDGAVHWEAASATGLPSDAQGPCLLATGDPGSVFLAYGTRMVRSTDGGRSWIPILEVSADIKALYVSPETPHVLFVSAAGAGGNLVSTDGGETFRPMSGMGEVTAFAAPRSDPPGLVYAASAGKVYSSENGGLLWRPLGVVGRPINALAVDPGSARVVYAAHDHGLSVSRDRGRTWQASTEGFPQEYSAAMDGMFYSEQILALAVDPARPGTLYAGADYSGVYRSTDSGRRWTSGLQSGLVSGNAHFLKIHPKHPRVMYLGRPDSVDILWRTTDGGQTWSATSDISRGFNIIAPALDPFDPDVIYSVGSNLRRSRDGGVTWSSVGTLPIYSVVVTGKRTLVAIADIGLVRSADGGLNWGPAFQGSTHAVAGLSFTAVQGDPGHPATVYAIGNEGAGEPRTPMVFRSKDGGTSWNRFLTGSYLVVPAPGRPRTIYTATGTTLLRTDDDGGHWEVVGPTPASTFNDTMVVDPRDPETLLVGTVDRGVLRSTDGGRTWRTAASGLARLGRILVTRVMVDPRDPDTYYTLPLGGGVFKVKVVD